MSVFNLMFTSFQKDYGVQLLSMFSIFIYTHMFINRCNAVAKNAWIYNLMIQGQSGINILNQVNNSNNLIDLVALSVEGNVDGGNWELVFMDGSNWELVDVDGGNWQVVTLGLETGLIGSPGQSEFLAFRGNPVRRSLVGVAHNVLVGGFAVRVVCDTLHLLLHLRFLASGVVRSSVAIEATR
jgi:hypothetical protein